MVSELRNKRANDWISVGISEWHVQENLLTTNYEEHFPHMDLPVFISWVSLPFMLMRQLIIGIYCLITHNITHEESNIRIISGGGTIVKYENSEIMCTIFK